jgi:asparagine synthase (glutamine-hydrolysing)
MCGIAGCLGSIELDAETRDRILTSLHHRGPDEKHWKTWPNATLLHTRLRIIDLSSAGAQPMSNEDGSVWTVFNGEIYNHQGLRESLAAAGHRFRGRSDTEVLPHLYEDHGEGLFPHLRGMFSIAILDTRKRRLLLARDRFGIKPLFFAKDERRLAFASEIAALRLFPGVDLGPDPQAISDFAALLFVPAPLTIHRGIRALEPGTFIDCNIEADGRVDSTIHAFHRFTIAPNVDLTLDEAVGQSATLVENAVVQQLESDVSLGALLSGGIDSSLVSLYSQQHVSGDLLTFNVRMPDPSYDETWAAETVATHIGSRHQILEMNGVQGSSWDEITSLLRQAGQPFADTSLFAVDAISRAMREHITVALSGDGGDEAFGGYEAYWDIATIDRLRRVPPILWLTAARVLQPLARYGLVRPTLSRRLQDLAGADDASVVQTLFAWVREGEHRELLADPDATESPRRLFEHHWEVPRNGHQSIDRLSARVLEVNLRLVLPNQFLAKVDTASMRHSLEVRVPLLDEDLIDFGLTLPHVLRVEGRTGKRVLRGLAARHLPSAIVDRPKQGFSVPVDRWVDHVFKDNVRDALLEDASPLSTYLERRVYAPWVDAFCTGRNQPGVSRQGLYQRVIMLLALDLSLREFTHAR